MLLASVSCTRHRARKRDRLHLGELVHGDGQRVADRSTYFNRVRVPVELGHSTVVTHNVDRRRGNQARVHQHRQRRLHIEGVPSSQTNEVRVTGYPVVGRVCIAGVDAVPALHATRIANVSAASTHTENLHKHTSQLVVSSARLAASQDAAHAQCPGCTKHSPALARMLRSIRWTDGTLHLIKVRRVTLGHCSPAATRSCAQKSEDERKTPRSPLPSIARASSTSPIASGGIAESGRTVRPRHPGPVRTRFATRESAASTLPPRPGGQTGHQRVLYCKRKVHAARVSRLGKCLL